MIGSRWNITYTVIHIHLLERDSDRVFVTDFGIAFHRRVDQTPPAGEFMGTPDYMSPEQARAEPADERSDIYALGLIAHEAASGKPPVRGTMAQVLDRQRHVEAPPLKYGNHQDQTLARCVELCLEKEPAKRFQTAAELIAGLEQSAKLRRYLPLSCAASSGRSRATGPRWR